METVLYTLIETIRRLVLLVQPFMPDASANILDQLSVPEDERSFNNMKSVLVVGQGLPKPSPVFPRFVADQE
jgi:methionyl-tRNA synthetase